MRGRCVAHRAEYGERLRLRAVIPDIPMRIFGRLRAAHRCSDEYSCFPAEDRVRQKAALLQGFLGCRHRVARDRIEQGSLRSR